jgi:chromosome partitioning protein
MQGATKQVNAIKAIGKRLGVAPMHRLLATMHDPASVLSRDLLDELKRRFGTRVIPVVITADNSLREAASFGQPVIEYAKESQGAKDYGALADWIIENALKPGASQSGMDGGSDMTAPLPKVEIVNGVAERTLGDGGAEMVAVGDAGSGSMTPPTAANGGMSRAADMAQRTRKLARAVAIAEAKPRAMAPAVSPAVVTRDPFASPASVVAAVEAQTMVAAPAKAAEPAAGVSQARPVFGAHATSRGVLFVQPISIGASVAVAGEFNDWTPEPLRANPVTGVLETLLDIKPGYSQYRLVVDGKWLPDPFNPVVAPNPFGGSNSVVVVPMGVHGEAVSARRAG